MWIKRREGLSEACKIMSEMQGQQHYKEEYAKVRDNKTVKLNEVI